MIDRRTFIRNTAITVGGVVLLSAGGNILAANKAKKPNLKEIDASKMKFEITKNGVLLIPFKMSTRFSFTDMKTYKTKEFPIKATKKTIGVSSLCVYGNKADNFVVEVHYSSLKNNYTPELEVQLLNKEKSLINMQKSKGDNMAGEWHGLRRIAIHKFNFGKIKIGDIKYIGIGAK